jgi:hypothetical protein|tara:strand:+ start:175 stop:348 length:174 start_codon:yes stop_codon:yes gene_type:complete
MEMSSLEEQLERCIKRQGEDSPVVQMLRDQISAEKRDAFTDQDRQRWITGSKPPSQQ